VKLPTPLELATVILPEADDEQRNILAQHIKLIIRMSRTLLLTEILEHLTRRDEFFQQARLLAPARPSLRETQIELRMLALTLTAMKENETDTVVN
jgi:exonuclease VII large subunit